MPTNAPPTEGVAALLLNTLPETADVTTWLFEADSFAPIAKMVNGLHYGIVSDHLGTPLSMFNENGQKVWDMELSIYGAPRQSEGWREACPFRYPGQYEDMETGLYYNRFRYYDDAILAKIR